MPRTPTVGEPVQYVLRNGQPRAALVTNAFGDDRANLTVFLDQSNDLGESIAVASIAPSAPKVAELFDPRAIKNGLLPSGASQGHMPGTLAVGSAPYDPTGQPGTWRYLSDAASTEEGGAS